MKVRSSIALAGALALYSSVAQAQPAAWCDGAAALATVDGSIGAGEYPGSSSGVGASFTGMLGAGVEMYVDSSGSGDLAIAIDATGQTCLWGANDTVVVYIDSIPGAGFNDTTGFTDAGDPGRIAVSGVDSLGQRAALTFAPGFEADYAIAIRADSASLFQLRSGTAHLFVTALTREPLGTFGTSCVKELGGISMAMLGSQAGNPIHWVATLLNPLGVSGPFRSNEFQGVASTAAGNIGTAAHALSAGDQNQFASFGADTGVSGPFLWLDFATFAGAGFTPTPTCGQLSSERWAATGMSDAPSSVAFGGTATTGDFARGIGTGTSDTGGIWSFSVATRDQALGVTPGNDDFTPGSFTMRVRNDGTTALVGVALAYEIHVLNSRLRGNRFDFSYSTDDVTYTPVAALDYTSPEAPDATPAWTAVARSTTLSDLAIPPGQYLYLRWTGDDVSGTDRRDRFALDDIVVDPTFAVCGNGVVEPGERCDAGGANGTTPCGCQTTCMFGAADTACGGGGAGDCDAPDTCDGLGACVDRFDAGTICRPTAGPCDAVETCDGTGPDCPADGFAAAGIICALADPSLPLRRERRVHRDERGLPRGRRAVRHDVPREHGDVRSRRLLRRRGHELPGEHPGRRGHRLPRRER
ncbi:MAG: hypothetical protein M5U28_53145 [Sandaracinaceae bacterium]|nr:hypothetical protein [Sandaracinaceae bacterium]